MKRVKALIIILVGLFLMTACSKTSDEVYEVEPKVIVEQQSSDEAVLQVEAEPLVEATVASVTYPLTVVDKFGKEIIIESEPQKVISFSPELVEIMYAINVSDKLIGRSAYCDYPEETASIPDMGDLFNLNVETIVEADPDLVLLSSMASEDMVNSLTNQGITVVTLDADTDLEGVYVYIHALGQIFNRVNEADQLTAQMKDDITRIVEKVKDLEKPTATFVVGVGEYDSVATGDTFISELMVLAGGENIAADGSNWMYSIELLVEKDPDMLICSKYWDTKAAIIAKEGYKDLSSVKTEKVYEVDENIFYRQGPRIVDAVQALAKIFHPEAF